MGPSLEVLLEFSASLRLIYKAARAYSNYITVPGTCLGNRLRERPGR